MGAGPLDDDSAAWLRLLLTPGVGRAAATLLVEHFGSPSALFATDAASLEATLGAAAAAKLSTEPPEWREHCGRTREWLAASPNRYCLGLLHPLYPARLKEAPDPPLLLFAEGRLELLQAPSVAIVGSRRATPQGVDHAAAFAAALAREGFTVVSGLALGIDAAAHEGALPYRDASTIAVVGTGLDLDYPSRHARLAHRIRAEGLVVSEFLLGTPPRGEHFPMRNRIIAGLSLGTLVIEAAPKSGSLITARLAAEAGREVFAVPGPIQSEQSRGCHELLRQGATLVENIEDILAPLRPLTGRSPPVHQAAHPSTSGTQPSEDPLLRILGHAPATLDQLADRSGLSPADLGARLLELELEGRIARLPGGLFQRRGLA